jgi:tetratricopeptide (TPR) repeat protein
MTINIKKKVLGFVCFILISFIHGQNIRKIDSLWNLYNDVKSHDDARIKAFFEVAEIYIYDNPDTVIKTSPLAFKLSQQIKSKPTEARLYDLVAYCYEYNDDYSKAIQNYQAELKIWESLNSKTKIGGSYSKIGNSYRGLSDYPKALEYLLKGLQILESQKDTIQLCKAYINLGTLNYNQNNFQTALENYLKALSLCEKSKNYTNLNVCIGNIGMAYHDLKNYNKAMEYYNKALMINEKANDESGIAANLGNIALIYDDIKNYEKALEYHNKSLNLYIKLNAIDNISVARINIADLYNKIGNHKTALENLKIAKALSLETENIDNLRLAHEGLAETYNKLGNYKDAFENYKQFKILTDSIFNTENSKAILDIKTQYEVEKSSAELKAKSDANEARQQLITYAIIIVLFIVSIFTILLLKRYQLINKQKQIIEQKIKETEEQKKLIEIKQKEIIDSITYAKRLQNAILPPLETIEKNLNNSFVYYQPKDIVAGDFYWMETVNDAIFIAAADSTGHGVPGAMVSVVCSNALNRAVKEFHLTYTGEILDKTRQLVLETFEKNSNEVSDGMDISLLSINKTKKEIQWSGAYNPLWYILDGEMIQIKADKQPIGKSENPTAFTTQTIQYTDNTTFYLFTDGFADQFGGPEGKKIKQKAFSDLLIKHHKRNSADQLEIIQSTFSDWKGELEQVDDVCVIGIRI